VIRYTYVPHEIAMLGSLNGCARALILVVERDEIHSSLFCQLAVSNMVSVFLTTAYQNLETFSFLNSSSKQNFYNFTELECFE
jgi:predicted metal-binding protein